MNPEQSNGFHPETPDRDTYARLAGPDSDDTGVEGMIDADEVEKARQTRSVLAAVRKSMEAAGFYAYITLDQQQHVTVASDDEAGRFDIRVDGDDFIVALWTSSPGLYMEEENQWKRRAMERLARITIPKITPGATRCPSGSILG